MKKILSAICINLLGVAVVLMPTPALCALPTSTINNLSAVLKDVLPAVVNISAQGDVTVIPGAIIEDDQGAAPQGQGQAQQPPQNPNPQEPPQPTKHEFENLGSGVIVDSKEGYILTNAHVLTRAKTITVTLADGRKSAAKLIGADPLTDVAVLQIKEDKLSAAHLGNSDDLQVGEPVVAIGNPFGLNQTVTSGIVSGLRRSALHIENYENFIQTDASINPGNSGGPLIDLQGKVIGINTAILAPSGGNIGIGFAIPANMARSVMEQLIHYGSVKRGLMGVMVNDLTPDLAKAFHLEPAAAAGAVVAMIVPRSPAEKAGSKAGDIILKVNGKPMKDATEVKNTIGLLRVGASISLEFLRQGKVMTITLVTEDPEKFQKEAEISNHFLYGLSTQTFDELTATQGRVKGVAVTMVKRDSAAWRAGLRRGDVIVTANNIAVTTIDELIKAAAQDKQQLLLNVYRVNGALFVVVK